MDETSITQYITDTLNDTQIQTVDGNLFYFYASERMMPFATLMTNDDNDSASNLSRPSVFRLNIGVGKDTYRSLFGSQPTFSPTGDVIDTGHDFTALDCILPHPIYAAMSWVCVLSPSDTTFQSVIQPLLAEAYNLAVNRHVK